MSQYFDNILIAKNNNTRAIIESFLTERLDVSKYKSIAINKIDMCLSNIPFYIVQIDETQDYNNINDIMNNNGFKTIFNLNILTNVNNEVIETQTAIYFKNSEIQQPNIEQNNKNFNNNNKYFTVKDFNTWLSQINKTINNVLGSNFSDILGQYPSIKKTFPTFACQNNKFKYYSVLESDDTNTIKYYHNKKSFIEANSNNSYCIGFCSEFNREFLRGFNTREEDGYYYINILPIEINFFKVIVSVNGNDDSYKIFALENNNYFEYLSYIHALVIETNVPIVRTYVPINKQSYSLYSDDYTIEDNKVILTKLILNHNTDQIHRIIFSNNNISDNTIKLLNGNITNLRFDFNFIDRYGNIIELYLNKGDMININIVFNA